MILYVPKPKPKPKVRKNLWGARNCHIELLVIIALCWWLQSQQTYRLLVHCWPNLCVVDQGVDTAIYCQSFCLLLFPHARCASYLYIYIYMHIYIYTYKVSSIGIGRQMAQMQVDPYMEKGVFFRRWGKLIGKIQALASMTTSEMPGQTLGRQGVMPPGPTPMVGCISAWRICAHDKLCICVFIYSCICSLPLAFYFIHSHMFSDFNFTNFQGFISGSRSFSQADQQSFTTAIPRSQLLSLVKSWLRFLVRLADIYVYIYIYAV